jgi:hypothetical protein
MELSVNTRMLMAFSSGFLALLGAVLSFAPSELLVGLGVPVTAPLPVLLQLAGASYLGLAFTNWTARGVIIGGIYARPLSLGNFVHFLSGSLALFKHALAAGLHPLLVGVLVGYTVLAIAFGYLVFGKGTACVATAQEPR